MELKFRTLHADEIDVRVQQSFYSDKFKGALLLLYKDARVDMNLLDEVVGPLNWKREHTRDNANCIVSIWDDEKKMWITKEDVGTESNTEAQKGLASDSFKRACVNFGIGRELYTSPKPMIATLSEEDFDKKTFTGRDGKQETKYEISKKLRFSVKEIDYDDSRRINKLVIIDNNNREVFRFPNAKSASKSKPKEEPAPKQPEEKKLVTAETTPDQFRHIWNSAESSNVTPQDIALVARVWGLFPEPENTPLEEVTKSVLVHSKCPSTPDEFANYEELCAAMSEATSFEMVGASVKMAAGLQYEQSVRDYANAICKKKGFKPEKNN